MNNNIPTVSVFMMAYNHEKYIAQALDSVLMQNVNFVYDIVIGEDCSTDNTRSILLPYKEKHPEKIKLLLHEKNIGAAKNQIEVLENCTGKYIAMLEGDDYWTDPYKLQKQVDFLEANEDFAICHHNMQVIYEDEPEKNRVSNLPEQKEVTTIEDLAKGNYIYTASCVFRRYDYELPEWFNKSPVGDYVLHLLNARYGKIKYLKDVMGVYRVHKGGLWGNTNHLQKLPKWVKMYDLLIGYFDKNISNIMLKAQSKYLISYVSLVLKANSRYEFENYFPKCFSIIPIEYEKKIIELKKSKSYKMGNIFLKPLSIIKKWIKK